MSLDYLEHNLDFSGDTFYDLNSEISNINQCEFETDFHDIVETQFEISLEANVQSCPIKLLEMDTLNISFDSNDLVSDLPFDLPKPNAVHGKNVKLFF